MLDNSSSMPTDMIPLLLNLSLDLPPKHSDDLQARSTTIKQVRTTFNEKMVSCDRTTSAAMKTVKKEWNTFTRRKDLVPRLKSIEID